MKDNISTIGIFFLLLILPLDLLGQQLRVELEKELNIVGSIIPGALNDSTSLSLGGAAGKIHFNSFAGNTLVGNFAGEEVSSGNRNSFLGLSTGRRTTTGSNNSFLGAFAGAENTIGSNNSYLGTFTGIHTNGFDNTFFGMQAGEICLGSRNSFGGIRSGMNSQEGRNTFFGYESGLNMITGERNAFFGAYAGLQNQEGDHNIAFGYRAGANDQGGSHNIYLGQETGSGINDSHSINVGDSAGTLVTQGGANIFIGNGAKSDFKANRNTMIIGHQSKGIRHSENNTIIGAICAITSNINQDTSKNSTAIGYNSGITKSFQIRFGNQLTAKIEGQVAYSVSSDRRHKNNIQDIDLGLDFINDLRPVYYYRINDLSDRQEAGLIAQEVLQALRKHTSNPMTLTSEDNQGIQGLRYQELIAPMVKSLQELDHKVTNLEKQVGVY